MAQQINSLYGANVYMDGNNLAGRISEMELPTLKTKTTDHNVLGMAGVLEVFSGFEKLEGKVTWNSIHPDVMGKLFNPLETVQLQLRGSVLTHTAQGVTQEVPYVCMVAANFKNVPLGGFKPQTGVEMACDYSATYIKLTIDGIDHLEFDVMNNTFKVDGTDVLDTYKTNLGW